ncbi:MAG TPA: dipeptide epimerase, partial [Pararhizobium sp.]|nr:dipeptide epimerase [Pararhizobium sp.]
MFEVAAEREEFPLKEAFVISRGSRTVATVVRVRLHDTVTGLTGHGECVPYPRYGESIDGVIADLLAMQEAIASGLGRLDLPDRMPPGAARNALDCVFWDLEAKRAGRPAYVLAGLETPQPVITAFTLSLGEPERMREAAARNAYRPLIKIKLGGNSSEDLARLEAVRTGAPAAKLIVDANEGWTVEDYQVLAPEMLRLGVAMVEQPLPAGKDEALAEIERPLPVCADESCHDRTTLAGLA